MKTPKIQDIFFVQDRFTHLSAPGCLPNRDYLDCLRAAKFMPGNLTGDCHNTKKVPTLKHIRRKVIKCLGFNLLLKVMPTSPEFQVSEFMRADFPLPSALMQREEHKTAVPHISSSFLWSFACVSKAHVHAMAR